MVGALFLVAACTTAPSTSPSPVATPGHPSAAPSSGPIESAGPSPAATPAATPGPTTPAVAGKWRAVLDQAAVPDAQWQDVVWTGRRFVATGNTLSDVPAGVFLTSTDGKHWRSTPSGGTTGYARQLAAGVNGVVAIGTVDGKTAAWRSADGRTWTYRMKVFPTTLKGDDEVSVTDVVATETGWLAVGRDDPPCNYACGESPSRALAWTSSDAESWTRVPGQASLSRAAMNAVAAFDGGYVAVGQGGGRAMIWTSVDAVTWTRVPDDPMFGPPPGSGTTATVSANGVASAFGSIVAVGRGLGVGPGGAPEMMAWRSTDGRTWYPARVDDTENGQGFDVAVATSTGFLASGTSGFGSCLGGVWASTDGASWACEAGNAGFEGFVSRAAAGSPTIEVAVGVSRAGCGGEVACTSLPGAIWWRPVR